MCKRKLFDSIVVYVIIQVVTEKTALVGDIIGISSFGNINSFSHVILRRNNKVKNDSKDINDTDYIPRIILASGRNEENARETLKKVPHNYINLTD